MRNRMRVWLTAAAIGLAGAAAAQSPGEEGAAAVAAEKLPVVFRGLDARDFFQVAIVGSAARPQDIAPDGSAQVQLEPGQTYEVSWGDVEAPDRVRFYLPRPAEGAAPGAPLEVRLRRGMRAIPDTVWRGYPWAAGENQKLIAAPPPPDLAPPRRSPPAAPARSMPQTMAQVPEVAQALETRLAGLEGGLASLTEQTADSTGLLQFLAGAALGLALLGLALGAWFYAWAWRAHREAVATALDRSIPEALRTQARGVDDLSRRLEAFHQQWTHDRDALRRGQELLAAHHPQPTPDATREELARLRAEIEALRTRSDG